MELAREVLAAFRRRMWPPAGRTVLESLRVLDWVDEHFGASGPRVAAGVSMGGDVAVALAGVDPRIDRIAALVATPNWARPGMPTLGKDRIRSLTEVTLNATLLGPDTVGAIERLKAQARKGLDQIRLEPPGRHAPARPPRR